VDRWFVWEAGQLLEELDSTAQHRVNAFAYLPGTDQPLARITGDAAGTIEFVQQDGRGDVIGLTQGASVTQHVLYGPWGNVEGFSGDSLPQTRLGWKGLVWEGGTAQLYYVRNRWYDPQSQSFLSEDPLGLGGGRNTYAYADNDPINGWDPSGLTMCNYELDDAYGTHYYSMAGGCGGGSEGGNGWGIADALNGLSGDGGGGGTGGLHGGGGGGGGKSEKLSSRIGIALKNWSPECIHAKADLAITALGDLSFIFGAGELYEGGKALAISYKAGVLSFISSPLWLGTDALAVSSRRLAKVGSVQGFKADVYLKVESARFTNTAAQTAGVEGSFNWRDFVPIWDTARSITRLMNACAP
jgi:RHS repeat-associated protein